MCNAKDYDPPERRFGVLHLDSSFEELRASGYARRFPLLELEDTTIASMTSHHTSSTN